MDLNDFRSLVTLVGFVVFVVLAGWTYLGEAGFDRDGARDE